MDRELERGTVIARDGEYVDVSMGLSAKCEGCKLCATDGGGELVLRAVPNPVHARVGDVVEIELPAEVKRTAAFALYVVPVIALLLGYLAGDLLGTVTGIDRDVTGAIGAITAVVVALAGLGGRERALSRGHTSSPQVRAIIARGPEGR